MQKLRAVRKVRLRGVNDALSDLPTQAGGFFLRSGPRLFQ
jgi:hypothetical protein